MDIVDVIASRYALRDAAMPHTPTLSVASCQNVSCTPVQVVAESRRQCEAALRFLAEVRLAFPEVLQAIKTKQLAQEILLFKEDHIVNLAKTGRHLGPPCPACQNCVCCRFLQRTLRPYGGQSPTT